MAEVDGQLSLGDKAPDAHKEKLKVVNKLVLIKFCIIQLD